MLGLQLFVLPFNDLQPGLTFLLGKEPEQVFLPFQIQLVLTVLDDLDEVAVCRFVSNAALFALRAEDRQRLPDRLRCEPAAEPVAHISFRIQTFDFKSCKASVKQRASHGCRGQAGGRRFLVVAGAQPFDKGPVLFGGRAGIPQDLDAAFPVKLETARMVSPRGVGPDHLADGTPFQGFQVAVIQRDFPDLLRKLAKFRAPDIPSWG